jgi:hypothetical protein
MLPERVRRYDDALAAQRPVGEEHHRIDICSVVEALLEAHLEGCPGWDSSFLMDGVLPASLTVSDSGVVEVVGLAVWSGNRGWYLDPVAARVELSADRKSVRAYSLRFGDAAAGLGKFPYRPHSKDRYRPPPEQWCFAFDRAQGHQG